MRGVLMVVAALTLLTGCASFDVGRYGVSVENATALKKLNAQKVDVGPFTAAESRTEIPCRAVGPITTPDKQPFEQYIRKALIDELTVSDVFVDSAPVLEKALAREAGLGWIGKHTNLLDRDGSWFLLGEVYTDLPLPPDAPVSDHCGSCRACIDVCPTQAIVAPYELDARRCISYLTIELRGSIPEELRPAIGNRIFGCDDCQLFCPWNKFAQPTKVGDFAVRHHLDNTGLIELFAWSEAEWQTRTAGSALRRAGYEGWLRNIAVALGNAPGDDRVVTALQARANDPSAIVCEHVRWALERQRAAASSVRTANSITAEPMVDP